jgi:hypothetical protein
VPCDLTDDNQKLSFVDATIRWEDMCLDGACPNISTGCAPLSFKPCSLSLRTMQWSHASGAAPFETMAPAVPGTHGCIDLWNSGEGPQVHSC